MMIRHRWIFVWVLFVSITTTSAADKGRSMYVLCAGDFKHHVKFFNTMEKENIVNAIPNSASWAWMKENIPLFECPDKAFEQIYYFRWWTYRKHIKSTPDGYVLTEFLAPVGHSGKYNTISCALGHHIFEGRWLHNDKYLDDYIRFWYRADNSGPVKHFHRYSNWAIYAIYHRYLVNKDRDFLLGLLNDFVKDVERWRRERGLPNGMYWQFDVLDGMEESISGSRTKKNIRPTINSYMYGSLWTISQVARLAGKEDMARRYAKEAAKLKELVQKNLWDDRAKFFKVRFENGSLSNAREEIGFIPWYFNLPDEGYEQAWLQLKDPAGFNAPMGITTAERRHPGFRTHGVGTCEWDGAVWPFATSQTLVAMANLLRNYKQDYLKREDYFEQLLKYAYSHKYKGKPYIGEYLDERNGKWLTPDSDRSRYYNHSTFCDLVIAGLVGIVPRQDETLEVSPLIPDDAWDWFCLDSLKYHGKIVTVLWDKTGDRYGKGAGLRIFVDGKEKAHLDKLGRITAALN